MERNEYITYVKNELKTTLNTVKAFSDDDAFMETISLVSELCINSLKAGNKILLAGNGGSAADSQHIAGELVSRFNFDRDGLPAIALTTDTSILTAIGNDYGYKNLFKRQIQALGNPGDIFLCYKTSGNSENIILAINEAKVNIKTVCLTGINDGAVDRLADFLIKIPSKSTPKIQEGHLICGHIICGLIEEAILEIKKHKSTMHK